jgi:hypothetical protein
MTSTVRRLRNARLRVLDLNTHTGASLRNGTLARLIKRRRPHVVLLQEVQREDFDDLTEALDAVGDADDWHRIGSADCVILLRADRFDVLARNVDDITYGENHTRHGAHVIAEDTITGRVCSFQSVHCQPLGRGLARANKGARNRQTRQLTWFADNSADRPDDWVIIDGGDVNQPMWMKPSRLPARVRHASAHLIWGAVGMVAASTIDGDDPARLDDFFVRDDPHVTGLRRIVIPTYGPGDDHDAVLLKLRITPADD